jgi:hypothetical protein
MYDHNTATCSSSTRAPKCIVELAGHRPTSNRDELDVGEQVGAVA